MDEMLIVDEQIARMRKTISSLEWDLNVVSNDEIKSVKKRTLQRYRKELKQLQEQRDSNIMLIQ